MNSVKERIEILLLRKRMKVEIRKDVRNYDRQNLRKSWKKVNQLKKK